LIDANNGYTPAQAREVLSQVADCDIHWVEEPFPEDRDECVSLKRFIEQEGWSTLVADGEGSEPHDAAFTEIVRAGGIDVVQFDMRGYTLTKWLRYLPVLEETGALAAPHNWGSHLSGFYIAQFGRGCARFSAAETDQMVMPAVVAADYELVDGMRKVPDTPGFGLTLDPDVFGEALTRDDAWTVGE
ncbi:MAG: mandelate racemase, partial [Rhodospirillaceae bacterium]|nr:mandelate racemase [Rhodospirillaceae bacterium]